MTILKIATDLIKIPSQTGNIPAKKECINYCKNFFKDKNIFIKEEESNNLPSLLISNTDTLDFDVVEIGHIDVVPAEEHMFNPIEKDGRLFGRGTIDMKSSIAVAMHVFKNILEDNINIKHGLLIVSDEETGGFHGANHWVNNIGIKSKVILDPDGGQNINTIIEKAKGVLMIKLISKGKEAHGSRPWQGVDANEHLMQTIFNLRKHFAYYSKHQQPKDKWISTMHVGTISGGNATNKISPYAEAKLDFRLTEHQTKEDVLKIINECLVDGVECEFLVDGNNVYNDRENKYLKSYAKHIKNEINDEVVFDVAHGASDGRYFAGKGMPIITHRGTGGCQHSKDEWVDINSLYQLERIQTEFLKGFDKIG